MPDYTIRQKSTGLTVTVRGARPPTAEELAGLFARAVQAPSGTPIADASRALVLGPRPGESMPERRATMMETMAAAQDPRLLADMQAGQAEAISGATRSYVEHGPGAVYSGAMDMARGNLTRGARRVLSGGMVTALPAAAVALPVSMAVAPAATALGVAGGSVAGVLAKAGVEASGKAIGLTEDQAGLAGDVAGLAGGAYGAKMASGVPNAISAWQAARRTERGVRAIKDFRLAIPSSTAAAYHDKDLHAGLPWIKAHLGDLSEEGAVIKAADTAIKTMEGHMATALGRFGTDTFRGNPLASVSAALASNPQARFVQKGIAKLVETYPQLKRPMNLQAGDTLRRNLNAMNEAALSANKYDVAAAKATDPAFAARDELAKSLREGIYDRLHARGVEWAAEMRHAEGSVITLRRAILRQEFTGDKQVPGSVANSTARRAIARALPVVGGAIGGATGSSVGAGLFGGAAGASIGMQAAQFVAPRSVTRDVLLGRAFANMRVAAPTLAPMPVPPAIRGALGPGREELRTVPERTLKATKPTPKPVEHNRVHVTAGPSTPDPSTVASTQAAYVIVRDPRTGRFKRVYTSETKP